MAAGAARVRRVRVQARRRLHAHRHDARRHRVGAPLLRPARRRTRASSGCSTCATPATGRATAHLHLRRARLPRGARRPAEPRLGAAHPSRAGSRTASSWPGRCSATTRSSSPRASRRRASTPTARRSSAAAATWRRRSSSSAASRPAARRRAATPSARSAMTWSSRRASAGGSSTCSASRLTPPRPADSARARDRGRRVRGAAPRLGRVPGGVHGRDARPRLRRDGERLEPGAVPDDAALVALRFGLRDGARPRHGHARLGAGHARHRACRARAGARDADPPLQLQFLDGHAWHQFFPLTGEGSAGLAAEIPDWPQWFCDDHLWLVIAVCAYVRETGDLAFLDERVSYADGPAETVFEHLLRGIEFTLAHRGPHGLPRAGLRRLGRHPERRPRLRQGRVGLVRDAVLPRRPRPRRAPDTGRATSLCADPRWRTPSTTPPGTAPGTRARSTTTAARSASPPSECTGST